VLVGFQAVLLQDARIAAATDLNIGELPPGLISEYGMNPFPATRGRARTVPSSGHISANRARNPFHCRTRGYLDLN